jgi:hypothetical protein
MREGNGPWGRDRTLFLGPQLPSHPINDRAVLGLNRPHVHVSNGGACGVPQHRRIPPIEHLSRESNSVRPKCHNT